MHICFGCGANKQRGLSTAFGWRLTPLKMTENSELVAEKAVTALSALTASTALTSLSAVWIPSRTLGFQALLRLQDIAHQIGLAFFTD
jgi:hypothetical protein